MKKVAIIMAGGVGSKLWPRGTEKNPKQFSYFLGEGTMIQNTFARLKNAFEIQDIFIVASASLAGIIHSQVPEMPAENLIIEPFARGTAPCLGLAVSVIEDKYSPDTIIYSFPSDHIISNEREFNHSLDIAAQVAHEKNAIVAIGLTPTRPETAFGYIQINDNQTGLEEYYDYGVRSTTTFAEKPDSATARRFIESGDFLWNSGIFIWTIDTFWTAFKKYLNEHYSLLRIAKRSYGKSNYEELLEDIYRQMQTVFIDYAIMEKATNVYVVESTFSWSDLANWDELYRLSMKDGRNNVIEGDVVAINSSNCLVNSNGKVIGIVGVENLIIIDSDESLLVCRRGYSDDVKEIVDYLRRKQINSLI